MDATTSTAGAEDFENVARRVRDRFESARARCLFSTTFLDPANFSNILREAAVTMTEQRRMRTSRLTEDDAYELVESFVRDNDLRADQDLNKLFWHTTLMPALVRDGQNWRQEHELAERRYKGIDAKEYRLYASDPNVVPRTGSERDSGKDRRAAIRTGGHVLAHPDAQGGDRIARIFEMNGLGGTGGDRSLPCPL